MVFKKNILKLLILTLSILLIFGLTSCGEAGSETIYPKETLSENTEKSILQNKDHVWKYLDKWDFPLFDSGKLKSVEVLCRNNYYKEIIPPYELALKTASYFLENLYDSTDLSDKTATTDALAYAMVESIGDRYAEYRPKDEYEEYYTDLSGKFVGIGITVKYDAKEKAMHVVSVSSNSPAEKAGVLADDKIISVGGASVAEIGYDAALNAVKGEAGTTVELGVKRNGEIITLTATRASITEESVIYSLDENKIGYIRITSFKLNTDEQFEKAVDYMLDNSAKGIIYDLRSNHGGYLSSVEHMLDYIAPKGTTLVSFSHNYGKDYVAKNTHTALLPSVVICNGSTASAAELFTAGIRDLSSMGHLDAVIVGEKTYGKGVMQRTYNLSDKSAVTMTVAFYNPPSGENYDGVGILPDFEVSLTDDGDAQKDSAYQHLKELINKK